MFGNRKLRALPRTVYLVIKSNIFHKSGTMFQWMVAGVREAGIGVLNFHQKNTVDQMRNQHKLC